MQRTIKFKDKAAYDYTHGQPNVQVMDNEDLKVGLKFVREQLTHLDPHLI